jgi:integrase
MSLFSQKRRLVGSLGFEPRIANAPGWYTKPFYPEQNQYTHQSERETIRRPHEIVKCEEQIDKTIELATKEGKRPNTIRNFYHKLRQLTKVADLMNPEDVKTAIGYSKLSNASKTTFTLAYEWFTKANGLRWEKPKFKWHLGIPIIPTTAQVDKIISATTVRYATIFKLMVETGIEGEELHETHRNQFDQTQNILNVKGLKGHGDNNYKLTAQTAEMLKQYLAQNPKNYPFPRAKAMSEMWQRARNKASQVHNDKELLKIPMKNLRNYSGAQIYFKSANSPIAVMRHLRHKKLETTMHYLQAINLDEEPEYDTQIAQIKEDIVKLNNAGYTYIQTVEGIGHIYRKRK